MGTGKRKGFVMNFREFREQLQQAGQVNLAVELPTGYLLPAHFHVTEVGNVQKHFIDCGGTRRQDSSCVLQTLVANDVNHRLTTDKLAGILAATGSLGISDDAPVELEIQGKTIETYSVGECRLEEAGLSIKLQNKSTACLAEDQCGIGTALPQVGDSCCGNSGCC